MSKRGPRGAAKLANRGEKYPEHVKLRAICDKSQCCYDFLEFLLAEKRYHLGRYYGQHLMSENPNKQELLAEFFEIDLDKIEAEKQEMLEECRKQQNKGAQ